MKVAIVHDHFLEFGGAERVVVAIKKVYPQADVYTAAYDENLMKKRVKDFSSWNIYSSWAKYIPFYKKLYSPLRFIAPWIWESFDFSSYDLVISSSGWFMSKGIITKPPTRHISYVHHQPRYLYYYETAVEWQKHLPVKIYAHFINHYLRMWDFIGSQRPDVLVANSEETQRRINKFYRRDATVIYPPVDIPESVNLDDRHPEYYVTLSRLTKTKNIDLIIKTANTLKIKLKIVGIGRDEAYLKSIAGNTVEFLGRIEDDSFAQLYQNAKAFINAGIDEEFGIAPIEAMGCGVPVIAYASGGLKETIQHGYNGLLFNELTEDALATEIHTLESMTEKDYNNVSRHAREESLKYNFSAFVDKINKI